MALAAGRSVGDLLVFYAGDTITDLDTSLWAGGEARVASLVVNGARIERALSERWQYYGLRYLGHLWKNDKHGDRLVKTRHPGVYRVHHRVLGSTSNYLVLGCERWPDEKTAPGSIRRFFEEFVPRTPHWAKTNKASWWN